MTSAVSTAIGYARRVAVEQADTVTELRAAIDVADLPDDLDAACRRLADGQDQQLGALLQLADALEATAAAGGAAG